MLCFALFPLAAAFTRRSAASRCSRRRGRLVNAWLVIAAAWFGYLFLSKSGNDFSRAWSLWWIAFGLAAHVTFRASPFVLALRVLRRRGYNQRHIVIVAAGRLGRDIALRLARTPWSGLSVRGLLRRQPGTGRNPRGGNPGARPDRRSGARPRRGTGRPGLDRPAAARGSAHSRAARAAAPALGGSASGPGHLQFHAAQPFGDRGRGPAGDQSHRVAALRRQSRDQGRRGLRVVAPPPRGRVTR